MQSKKGYLNLYISFILICSERVVPLYLLGTYVDKFLLSEALELVTGAIVISLCMEAPSKTSFINAPSKVDIL